MTNRPYVNTPHIGFEQPTEAGTYPIGELIAPEQNEALNNLYDQLQALESHPMPERVDEPDRTINLEVFPLKDAVEASDYYTSNPSAKQRSSESRKHDIDRLFRFRDEWGNNSEVVRCEFGSVDASGNKQEANYLLALLKDSDGKVETMIADTMKNSNALYIWRRDVAETDDWEEVVKGSKGQAKDLGALAVKHVKGGIEETVLDKATMPVDKFKRELEKRQARRKK